MSLQKEILSKSKTSNMSPEVSAVEHLPPNNKGSVLMKQQQPSNGSIDLQTDEALEAADSRFLEVCLDGDVEDLVQLFEEIARSGETLSPEMLNCPDASGRIPVSHLCGNGFIEMLDLLEDIKGIDYNTADSEGNTPLHFAAQAGHIEVVSFLLTKVRGIKVDPVNNHGFTPLMKAALQGRVKCSKMLLFSGASPTVRDFGRGFTAAQWAHFCGRHVCAESIEKFVRTAMPGTTTTGQGPDEASSKTTTSTNSTSAAAAVVKQPRTSKDKKKKSSRSTSSSGSRGTSSLSRDNRSATSWLSKTFKRAFAVSETSGGSTKEAQLNDFSRKLVIPQVQITEESLTSKGFWSSGSNGATVQLNSNKVSDKIEKSKEKKKKKGIK